jgi:hypothetical protein
MLGRVPPIPATAARKEQPPELQRRAMEHAANTTTSPAILPEMHVAAAEGVTANRTKASAVAVVGEEENSPRVESEHAYFEINAAMGVFTGNAGLVFGLIYAFMFGRSYSRFDSLVDAFYAEVSAIHKLVLLVQTVTLDSEAKRAMLDHLTEYTDQCRYEVTSGIMVYEYEQVEVMTKVYAIVPALYRVVKLEQRGSEGSRAYTEISGVVAETMLVTIGELCSLRYQRWSLSRRRIPVVLWALVILSAVLMFFGVLVMQSGWHNVDATLCMLITAGIGLMM